MNIPEDWIETTAKAMWEMACSRDTDEITQDDCREDAIYVLTQVVPLIQASVLQPIRNALSNHPKTCDKYPLSESTCGWKHAVSDVEQAMKKYEH